MIGSRTSREAIRNGQDPAAAGLGVPQAGTARHWFDFTCPFCYVARSRDDILSWAGLLVVHLPFQAHPEIPEGGVAMGLRSGEIYEYERLEREAKEVGLPLHWPPRLPNSRYALTVAEWVRRFRPEGFDALRDRLFLAHFGLEEDIGDNALVDRYASETGAERSTVHSALSDGSASAAVEASEYAARSIGIAGTPMVGGKPAREWARAQDAVRTDWAGSHRPEARKHWRSNADAESAGLQIREVYRLRSLIMSRRRRVDVRQA
jgi:predicted DsbA family dithiol-disulfide isomerase